MRTWVLVVCACACGGQIGIANTLPPDTNGGGGDPHRHNDDTIALPDDEANVEPEHPMVTTLPERATAHVHTPKDVCSGMVIGPKEVITAHQCFPEVTGVCAVTDANAWRVEVASTALTWTARHVTSVVTPACDWKKLDIAVLVLDEPADWITPMQRAAAPSSGAIVRALGFGHCRNEHRALSERTGQVLERQSDALEVDIGLCQGDVGGGFIDSGGGLVGIVSHQDDPDNADRHTTTGFRLDTPAIGHLFDAAAAVAKGQPGVTAPSCD